MNCKFVLVKTGLNSFIPLQHKLISLAALSNNYWLYVFNATRFQIFLKKILDTSFYWLILKSYHVILILMATSSFSEDVQKIIDKTF